MNPPYTFLLSFLLLCSGCSKVNKSNLEGKWIRMNFDQDQNPINELFFKQDSISFTDGYLFKQTTSYQLINNSLLIELEDNLYFQMQIQALNHDTLIMANGLKYSRTTFSKNEFNFKTYPLIEIKTHQLLDKNSSSIAIHYYKSAKGETVIKVGDTFADFNDLPLFLERRDCFNGKSREHRNHKLFLFIGKGISLIDLKIIYYFLETTGFNKVSLILNKRSVTDYEVFVDKIDVWRDDYKQFMTKQGVLTEPLPPPPPGEESRQAFLGKNGKAIKINSPTDFNKLSRLLTEKRYVVLIENTMSIKDYIELKSLVYNLGQDKNITITTEIL